MHRLPTISLSAVLFAVAAVRSEAAPANIIGYGVATCSDVVSDLRSPGLRQHMFDWAGGFFSGANMVLVSEHRVFRDLSGISSEAVIGQIASFCASNPDRPLVQALEEMFVGLKQKPWKR